MKCSCPKCRAHVDLDLPEIPEEGTKATCNECNARFIVTMESFGGRALRKTGDITCADCGAYLGAQLNCPECGALFPNYLVASFNRKKTRAKKVKLEISPLPRREQPKVDLPRIDGTQKQQRPATKKKGGALPKQTRLLIVALLLLVVGGGGAFFYMHKSNEDFTKNFIMTIYCTRFGEKKAMDTSAKIAAEWKMRSDAGNNAIPSAKDEDARDLAAAKDEMDKLLHKVRENTPPKDMAESTEKLGALCAAYEKAHLLANAPGGTLPGYTAATAKADADYRAAAKDLKSTLPADVVEKIKTASKRYKALQGFLEL